MNSQNRLLAVGVEGSPRRTGNSTALLNAYLEGVASVGFDTESIYLNGLTYKGCQACDRCVRGESCKLDDDLNHVFPILKNARIWAMASPIYYDGVSGQLKTFFGCLEASTRSDRKAESYRCPTGERAPGIELIGRFGGKSRGRAAIAPASPNWRPPLRLVPKSAFGSAG